MQKSGGVGRTLNSIIKHIQRFLSAVDRTHRSQVTAMTEFEQKELENLFVLLLMGSFMGVPSPPSFVSAELLPHLEHELKVMNERAKDSFDTLAEMAGTFNPD
jgi:hypothetical protein